jgi:integral membrane protein
VSGLFKTYRVLAFVVGVLLLVGTVGFVLKYAHVVHEDLISDGSGLQQLGEDLTPVWLVHGWVYMVYVVVAFVLTQRAGWPLPRFLLMMVAGLVPALIFWVERRVTVQLREEHPELANAR